MMTRTRAMMICGIVTVIFGAVQEGFSQPAVEHLLVSETVEERFPAGAVGLLQAHDIAELIQRVEDSDLPDLISKFPDVQKYWESEDYRKALAGKSIAETFLAMDLLTLAKKLTGGDVSLAIYPTDNPKKPDILLLVQVEDADILKHIHKQLEPFLVLTEAATESEQADREGIKTFKFQDKLYFALKDNWLLTANKNDLLQRALALNGKRNDSMASDANLKMMQEQSEADALLSLYVNTEMIADGTGGRFIPAKLDNPVGSLLLGGLTEMAAHSPYAGATLKIDEEGLVLRSLIANQPAEIDEPHQVFYAADEGGVPQFPALNDRQFGFAMHRDFATWYQQREELLEEKVLPSFDQFETGISNLLPGRDFGTDILPLLGKNLSFISAPQSYEHLDGKPGVQLPGFAIVVDLADEKEGAQVIQLFFQTLAAVLNIEAGKQGRQPWLVQSKMHNDVNVQFGKYMEKPKGERLPIVFNFMPASAQVKDRYILSSSVDLCKQLIDQFQNPNDSRDQDTTTQDLNVDLQVGPVITALEQNKELLQARAVQDGKDLETAQVEFDLFVELLGRLKEVALSSGAVDDSYRLELKGSWSK